MLVLARKKDEGIVIGDDIVIRVVEIQGNQIRIGIDAPKHVRIVREEIIKQVGEENIQSLAAEKPDISAIKAILPSNK